jgi:hypothetical protein
MCGLHHDHHTARATLLGKRGSHISAITIIVIAVNISFAFDTATGLNLKAFGIFTSSKSRNAGWGSIE